MARNPSVGYTTYAFSLQNRTSTTIGTTPNDIEIVAIAERPSTGGLYAFSTGTDKLYTLDKVTGQIAEVGDLGVDLPFAEYGMSFDPITDELRLISDAENLRIDPADGSLIATDTSTSPSLWLGGIAYTPPMDPPTSTMVPQTTLYYADNGNVRFGTVGGVGGNPSPNGGEVQDIGSTDTFSQYMIGLDFSSDGTAYLLCARTGDNVLFLYTINLSTGLATLVGEVDGDIVPQAGEVVGFVVVEN